MTIHSHSWEGTVDGRTKAHMLKIYVDYFRKMYKNGCIITEFTVNNYSYNHYRVAIRYL